MDYLIILLVIINIILILYLINAQQYIENMTSGNLNDEAIQNLASVYNKELIDATNIHATGNLIVDGNVTFNNNMNFLPKNTILMVNGTDNYVPPTGWALCDGTNGTPDLRGRFPICAGNGKNLSPRQIGSFGGEEMHTLSVDEIPSHTHMIHTGSGEGCTPYGRVTQWAQCDDNGMKGDGIIESVGGNKAHNNLPPFYALYFIMKL